MHEFNVFWYLLQPAPPLKSENEESQLPENAHIDMHTPDRDRERERAEFCNSTESLSLPPPPPVRYTSISVCFFRSIFLVLVYSDITGISHRLGWAVLSVTFYNFIYPKDGIPDQYVLQCELLVKEFFLCNLFILACFIEVTRVSLSYLYLFAGPNTRKFSFCTTANCISS